MNTLRLLLTAVLACTAACDGCNGCNKSGDKGAEAPVDPEEAPEKLGRTARLNAAMQCLNRHSAHVFEAQRTYLQKADAAQGPAAGVTPELLEMYGVDNCRDDSAKAMAASPAQPELDVPLRAYVRTLTEYGDRFRALSAHYQAGQPPDDDGKKASELHGAVMSAFKAFEAADAALKAAVNGPPRAP
jgi:hypothetical protein